MFNINNLLLKKYLLLPIQIGAPIKETLLAKTLMNRSGTWNLLAHKSSLRYVLLCTDTPALLTGPEELKLCPETKYACMKTYKQDEIQTIRTDKILLTSQSYVRMNDQQRCVMSNTVALSAFSSIP